MSKKGVFRKILKRVFRYRWSFSIATIFSAVSVLLTLYIPILVGDAIDCVVGKGSVDFVAVKEILFVVGICITIGAVTQWIADALNNKLTANVVRDLRNDAFEKFERLPLKYIDGHSYGDIVSRIISDADQFADGMLIGFSKLSASVITIVGTLIFMLSVNVGISLVVILITPLSLFVAKFIASRTYSLFKQQSELRGEQTAYTEEMIQNRKVVAAFGYEKEAIKKYNEINTRLRDCSLKATFFSSLTNPCTRFVNSVVYAGVALAGALLAISTGGAGITVGGLSCFLSYANKYTKPFNEISEVITELQNAIACAWRLFELIEEQEQVPDAMDAVELLPNDTEGQVDICDVEFSYTPERELIKNFNLKVASGQRVAIVGPTGCGKTTLINLLVRFYDANSGQIEIDGNDISKVTRKSLRSVYGVILQDTWLKEGTIRENIAFGKPEATQEEIEVAAKAARVHGFIKRLPQGYDTYISSDGGSLSQGQKQLLCIARVMLCLPPLLILDEATSSIDTRTEVKIQEAFGKMMKGRTSFIVAHRLSTIRNADIILAMKDGKVVEQGSHEALIQRNGLYSELYYSSQA